jgi:hypothetical protein
MSKSVVLICPVDVTLLRIYTMLNEQWPGKCWHISGERPEAQVQYYDNGCWYVSFNELTPTQDVRSDYEDNDEIPQNIKEKLVEKVFYLVSFNDYEFCGTVIRYLLSRLIASSPDIWLDNDYGVLIPARSILAEFDVDPNWDWRSYHSPES